MKPPNAIATYVDARTGAVLYRLPYYDPTLVGRVSAYGIAVQPLPLEKKAP